MVLKMVFSLEQVTGLPRQVEKEWLGRSRLLGMFRRQRAAADLRALPWILKINLKNRKEQDMAGGPGTCALRD